MNRNILAITFRYIFKFNHIYTSITQINNILSIIYKRLTSIQRVHFLCYSFYHKVNDNTRKFYFYILKDEFECHCHSKTHLTYLSVCYYVYDMFAL